MEIGKAFRELREEQNISRAEVARQIGCTQSAISKIERGKVLPKQSTIEAFCTILRIPLARFYFCALTIEDFGSVDPIRY